MAVTSCVIALIRLIIDYDVINLSEKALMDARLVHLVLLSISENIVNTIFQTFKLSNCSDVKY